MKKEIRKVIEKEVARLVSRAMVAIKNVYRNDSGYLRLQDFFFAVPFQLNVITLNEKELAEIEVSDVYPSIFNYLRGYVKLVDSDTDVSYLKVFIDVLVPDNLNTVSDAIKWVEENLIFNEDLGGEYALLFLYMHEVMHILHKHTLPSINARFDAIIENHSKNSKLPDGMKHKIKNFASDFLINSMLLETAKKDSALGELVSKIQHDKKNSFLYHPDLSANKGHTVETIIVELLKDMEVEDITADFSMQDGQSQDGQGDQQSVAIGKKYKIKYDDFEYEIYDLHDTLNDSKNSKGKNDKADLDDKVSKAIRDISNQMANKFKGSECAEIAVQLGIPIEVTVDWLGRLESDLFREVRHRTNKVSISWRRLKNKYRHIAKLPATVHYENVLNVIIAIDQSSSMSDYELRKINYVISKLAKRVKSCRVIIHDYEAVYNKLFERNVDKGLEREILKKRYADGGTSHKDVFEIIEKDFEEKPNEDFLVLIFSDMESNIEELWNKYKWTSVLKTYLVSSHINGIDNISSLPATKIIMDTGEVL